MKNIIPPRGDLLPLAYFLGLVLAFNMAALWMPMWARAAYCAWLAVGVAALVDVGKEPGLPSTFMGNLRRILRAHLWPLYM